MISHDWEISQTSMDHYDDTVGESNVNIKKNCFIILAVYKCWVAEENEREFYEIALSRVFPSEMPFHLEFG